jgi:hypothetical protein
VDKHDLKDDVMEEEYVLGRKSLTDQIDQYQMVSTSLQLHARGLRRIMAGETALPRLSYDGRVGVFSVSVVYDPKRVLKALPKHTRRALELAHLHRYMIARVK